MGRVAGGETDANPRTAPVLLVPGAAVEGPDGDDLQALWLLPAMLLHLRRGAGRSSSAGAYGRRRRGGEETAGSEVGRGAEISFFWAWEQTCVTNGKILWPNYRLFIILIGQAHGVRCRWIFSFGDECAPKPEAECCVSYHLHTRAFGFPGNAGSPFCWYVREDSVYAKYIPGVWGCVLKYYIIPCGWKRKKKRTIRNIHLYLKNL